MRPLLYIACLAGAACAQVPTEPPALIQLIRTQAIDREPAWPYANMDHSLNVFGLRTITGATETWMIELHDSFGSIENADKLLSSWQLKSVRPDASRTMVALYRPDWSYRPDLAVKLLPKARYYYASVHHVRPGFAAEFGEAIRVRRIGYDRINFDRPDIAYQVVSGAQSAVFVFLAPLTSLKTLDDALARTAGAADSPATGKALADIELSREHLLLRVDPKLSRVSEAIANEDRDFWRPQ
jgi:hypothetical protein